MMEHKNTYKHSRSCQVRNNGMLADTFLIPTKKEEDKNNEDDRDVNQGEEPKKIEKKVSTIPNINNKKIKILKIMMIKSINL